MGLRATGLVKQARQISTGKQTLKVVERPTKKLGHHFSLRHQSESHQEVITDPDPLQIPKVCFPAESNGIFRADGKKTLSSASDCERPSAHTRKCKS